MAPFGIQRVVGAAVAVVVGSIVSARAADCPVDHGQLAHALRASVKASGGPSNGGFENHEWASVVARDGTVCAVAFSGSRADRPMARQPGYFDGKGNYRERLQP